MTHDLTVDILRQIRDGITSMHGDFNDRFDGLGDRFDGLGMKVDGLATRLDGTNERLGRVEQGLLDLGQFMRQRRGS